MGNANDISNNDAVFEHRSHDVDIEHMARAEPGVIGHDHIPRTQGLGGKPVHHKLQGSRRAAHEYGNRIRPLRHQLAISIEHRYRQIIALCDNGRKRGPHQGGDDLVGNSDQAIPHNAHTDCIEFVVHGSLLATPSSAMRF